MEKELKKEHLTRTTKLYQEIQVLRECSGRMERMLQEYINSFKEEYFEDADTVTIDFDSGSIKKAEA